MDDRVRSVKPTWGLVAAAILALALPEVATGHSLVRVNGGELTSVSADATSLNTLTVRLVGGTSNCAIRRSTAVWIRGRANRETWTGRASSSTCSVHGPASPSYAWTQAIARTRWSPTCPSRLRRSAGKGRTGCAQVRPPTRWTADPARTRWTPAQGATRSGCAMGWWTWCAVARAWTGSTPTRSTSSLRTARPSHGPRRPRRRRPRAGGATGRPHESRWARPCASASADPESCGSRRRRARWARWPRPGYLDVAGLALPLQSRRQSIHVAGGGAELRIKLSRRLGREARRAFRRGRRVTVRLAVVATDSAGNSAQGRAPTIRLEL
jgi:hypothetical protein